MSKSNVSCPRSEGGLEVEGALADERGGVELGVAPHLPLLHHALLHAPAARRAAHARAPPPVGLARVQLAALLAHLAASEVEEVATTMLTLGTPGVLVDMFFEYPNNNFLHAQVYTLVKHALNNRVYRTQYARHLLIECDLLTRLMDVFEENRTNNGGTRPRGANLGHVVQCLGVVARALAPPDLLSHALALPPRLQQRWRTFLEEQLRALLQHHDTPLGGYYPSENFYEVEIMPDTLAANYDFNDMAATGTIEELADDVNADGVHEMCGTLGLSADTADFIADGLGIDDDDKLTAAKNNFLELASQRFDNDMWEDSGEADVDEHEHEHEHEAPAGRARDVLDQHSPWESAESGSGGGEGWAQFGSVGAGPGGLPPHDPFAPPPPPAPAPPRDSSPQEQHFTEFSPFWSYENQQHDSNSTTELESNLRTLRLEGELTDKSMDEACSVELANNLLTAMSAMSADAIANIVNANLPAPPPAPAPTSPAPPPGADQADAPSSEHR